MKSTKGEFEALRDIESLKKRKKGKKNFPKQNTSLQYSLQLSIKEVANSPLLWERMPQLQTSNLGSQAITVMNGVHRGKQMCSFTGLHLSAVVTAADSFLSV